MKSFVMSVACLIAVLIISTKVEAKLFGNRGGCADGSCAVQETTSYSEGSAGGSYSGGSAGGQATRERKHRLFHRSGGSSGEARGSAGGYGSNGGNGSSGGYGQRNTGAGQCTCPNCGKSFDCSACAANSASAANGCGCCDKCTGKPGCPCGCANCSCDSKTKRGDQPLDPARPDGMKNKGVKAPAEK